MAVNFTEAMVRTLTAAFSPQIVEAMREITGVIQRYDDRLARMEAMVELLVLRSTGEPRPRGLTTTVIDQVQPDA